MNLAPDCISQTQYVSLTVTSEVIRKHWQILQKNINLRKNSDVKPIASFRKKT